ncbi:Hypothetical predicted protein [Paramuricea clavata]|uniref:Uncharacterized protein n=1 Tax=Paramuricea clavata TaxID=317549 RepID=A0A7D9JY07_PARCT|nr:Hypothetical predicted protein [Paramuricea clavata]
MEIENKCKSEGYRCPTTNDAVVTKEPKSLDTLVELACIFREKHEIFLRVTKLLTILCGNEDIRKSLLSMEKAVNKIKSIFALTRRKHEFEMKRNTAKAKRLSVCTQNTKKKVDNNSTVNPLAAVTSLIETLGLGVITVMGV